MVVTQARSKRKSTGARYKATKGKKLHEKGRVPSMTLVGTLKGKTIRTRGSNAKHVLLKADVANVFDPKTKKHSKLKIMTVVESPANRHYVRRNILTKGTIIKTDKGNAKVSSRPGQDGTINAVLV